MAPRAQRRLMISHGTIDIDASKPGTQVIIQWGDYGGPIKEIRAQVDRYPFLSEGRNKTLNVTAN